MFIKTYYILGLFLILFKSNQSISVYKKVLWGRYYYYLYFFNEFILFLNFFPFIFISWRVITLQHCSGYCHTLTWISHGVTWIPHPDPPSHLPLHPIPLGLPSAPEPIAFLKQNFVVFSQTTWISHRYTFIPSLLNLSPVSLPIPLL